MVIKRLAILSDAQKNNSLYIFPFSLPYSGNVARDSGANVYQGTYGLFWSTGANSATNARDLNFNGVNVWPEGNNYKSSGFSVRCAKNNFLYNNIPFSLPYSGNVNKATGDDLRPELADYKTFGFTVCYYRFH